jgi:thiosulfate dehydrogenase [quinone] large subunit
MDNSTGLQRWLAVVRVVTGGVFVYMGTGHLLGGLATADGFQKLIGGFAKTDPIQPYTSVMVPILLSAPAVFGPLFVFGMLAAGLGLLVGLFTRIALLGAVWVSLNNLLMGFGAGGVHHSINILMLTIELGFLWTGAWRPYSLDTLLFARGVTGGWRRSAVVSQGR